MPGSINKTILKEKLNSFSEKKKFITKNTEKDSQRSKKLFTVEQSQTILNRIKFLRIKKLFDLIDSKNLGFINKESVAVFRADPHVMRILKPFFEDIINRNTNCSLIEFEEEMDKFLMKISTNDRMIILDLKNSRF